MAEANHETYLFQKLDTAIRDYDEKCKRLKRWSYFFKIAVLFLSACSTVLLGLTVADPRYAIWSRNIALVMGATSTFLIGLSAFWNLESYWLMHKVLLSRLHAVRERFGFLRAAQDGLSPEQIQAGFEEYQKLMDERIQYWEHASKAPAGVK